MSIIKAPFGQNKAGQPVSRYTMTNRSGASVSILDYGGIVQSILVPDRDGKLADVALGFDTIDGYLIGHGCMGDTIGRYGNRIAKGQFEIDGVRYQLGCNNGENHLHGGPVGFNQRMWEAEAVEGEGEDSLRLHYVSPDGEMSFPARSM